MAQHSSSRAITLDTKVASLRGDVNIPEQASSSHAPPTYAELKRHIAHVGIFRIHHHYDQVWQDPKLEVLMFRSEEPSAMFAMPSKAWELPGFDLVDETPPSKDETVGQAISKHVEVVLKLPVQEVLALTPPQKTGENEEHTRLNAIVLVGSEKGLVNFFQPGVKETSRKPNWRPSHRVRRHEYHWFSKEQIRNPHLHLFKGFTFNILHRPTLLQRRQQHEEQPPDYDDSEDPPDVEELSVPQAATTTKHRNTMNAETQDAVLEMFKQMELREEDLDKGDIRGNAKGGHRLQFRLFSHKSWAENTYDD